ncbi:hypothetical protein F5Y17DRAFT_415951 [Xylariaceae sp. FL0594]|nr:hypothetical protein F5Y17DRAFT_415951 [Xylariaceae sp. FL0594]
MKFVSYWIFPILSGLIWLGTLLGLFLYWIIDTHETRYASMQDGQTIAYISDVGAAKLKPLFVVGCVLTTVFLDISFICDRLLRHKGVLVPNTSIGEKVLSGLCIFFAFVGTIGLTFLSGFDTARYPKLHDIFLLLFIAGYLLSAVFICWEFRRLAKNNRQHRILKISFYVKLAFIFVELALAIAFAVNNFRKNYNVAAILEWIVSVIFSFYVFSFVIDLWPAVATRHGTGTRSRYDIERPMTTREAEEGFRTGHYGGFSGDYNYRTTHDSDRTLTEEMTGTGHHRTVIPAAASAASPHKPHRGKGVTQADNF